MLQEFEDVLRKGTDKFMGLDFEYMNANTPRVAVVQLGVGEEVLVFQWCRYVYVIRSIDHDISL